MVKFAILPLFSLLALIAKAEGSLELEKGSWKARERPAIVKILIEENGAWSDKRSSSDETPSMCASFILKESDVRRFFRIARFSSSYEQVHDLEISRCYAAGSAKLKDGRQATWLIDRARLGVFKFPDGNTQYFYCKKCDRKLYWSD